jgi:hypothetical protein
MVAMEFEPGSKLNSRTSPAVRQERVRTARIGNIRTNGLPALRLAFNLLLLLFVRYLNIPIKREQVLTALDDCPSEGISEPETRRLQG